MGIEVSVYDAAIRRFIPGYEQLLATAAREVARDAPGLVLDLGAGTGALSEAILEASPPARVDLIDVDGEMLARARSRLEPFRKRVRLLERSFDGPLPTCGAVAAALALHHVPSMGTKRDLYARIYRALRPGGVFVNADATMPSEPRARAATRGAWVAHMVTRGIREEQAYGHLAQWAEEDTYFPLTEELEAVSAAGFAAECVWTEGPMSVVVGRKRA